jgi:anti-sigma B factor antagonist
MTDKDGERPVSEGLAIEASLVEQVFVLLDLRGELTGESRAPLQDAVASAVDHGVKLVRVDLAHVGFMDSSGLSQLILTQEWLAARGVGLQLANVPLRVAKVMRVTRTDMIFDIESS